MCVSLRSSVVARIVPRVSTVRQIEDYSLVSFVPLNIHKDGSMEIVLAHIDNALQYGEDMEPKIPKDLEEGGDSGDV
jgi:hypothetical protein